MSAILGGLVLLGLSSAASQLQLRPGDPRPGDVLRVDLDGAETATAAWVDFEGHRYQLVREDGGWAGYVAVPIELEPGPAPLFIQTPAGTSTATVRIRDRSFPSSRLKVSPRFTKTRRAPALERRLESERAAIRAVWAAVPTAARSVAAAHAPTLRPRFTSVYGVRRVFNGQTKSRHYGLDLKGRVGDPVRAVFEGKVVLASDRYFSGGTVVLDHGGGLFSLYFHLSKRRVREGDLVRAGERIGAVGSSGRVTGPHLHLSIAVRAEPLAKDGPVRGLYVDPAPVLEGVLSNHPSER